MKYESFFFNGYDTFKDGVVISTPDLSILYCNPAFRKLVSIPDTVLIPDFDSLFHLMAEQNVNTEGIRPLLEQVKINPEWTGLYSDFLLDEYLLHIHTTPLPVTIEGLMGRIWTFTDPSHIFRTENPIIQSENLFKTIFNLIPEGIAISDLTTGKFYEVNEHFSKWWGYSREEVIGKSAIDLGFWVDINERNDIVDRLQRDGWFHLVPVKMRGKDKKIKEILFSGRIITIDDHQFMLTIPIDVTKIRQYEEKIISLASFIELNPNPVIEINESGIITMNNEAAVTIITRLTGTDDIRQFLPEPLDDIIGAIHTGNETTFFREVTIRDRIFMVHIYITNQYRTARMYATDITDRKIAESQLIRKNEELAAAYEEIISTEEELRQNYDKLVEQEQKLNESEKKLRVIVDHIPGIVLTTDTQMRIKSIFGAALEKVGLFPNEGVGRRIEELLPHMDVTIVKVHEKALNGIESSIETHFSDQISLLYVSPIRDMTDTITGTIGIAFDITDQKKLEKERKSLLIQLEHNLVELAILNDKIRNPLTVIATLVDMHAPQIEVQINQSIKEIDDIITNLDKRWIESEKTVNFLQKHYGIGNW